MEWQITIDGKVYDGIIGDRNYYSNNIISDNEPIADSLNKIANYLNTEDFVEKRYYPAWQDFTVVGTEYYLTLDQNATSNFTIDNLNRVATDILDFSVINPTNRNLMYKSGSLLNINSNVVRVLSFDSITGKVTLNFTPKSTFRINYLCQYANNEVPIGKKLEVENTEITVQNSDDASEIAYNNSTSALTSTDVQSAIDELVRTAKATSHEDLSNIQQVGTGITNGHISDSTQTIEGAKTFSTSISTPIIKAISDSTSAVSITKADGISKVVEVDTTNSKLIVNGDILVQSLSGISDRNLGVDALGNLKIMSSSGVATASAILDFGNEENYVTVDIADGSIVGNEKIFVSYEGAEEVALQGLNCGLLSKSVGVGYTIFGGAPNGASGQFTVNIIKL